MEKLAAIWNSAPLWGALVAVIVLVFVIARLWRSRPPQTPTRSPAPSMPESDDDLVDSSHIGFAPLVGNQAHFDADGTSGRAGTEEGRR